MRSTRTHTLIHTPELAEVVVYGLLIPEVYKTQKSGAVLIRVIH